jgi:sec-independent protein translocase protein TatA
MGYENVVIVVMVAIALLFGAKKLPELARSLGRAQSEFEKARIEVRQEISSIDHIKDSDRRAKLEDIASRLEIENVNSLSDEDLRRKILESIKNDNRDIVT